MNLHRLTTWLITACLLLNISVQLQAATHACQVSEATMTKMADQHAGHHMMMQTDSHSDCCEQDCYCPINGCQNLSALADISTAMAHTTYLTSTIQYTSSISNAPFDNLFRPPITPSLA